MYKIKKMVQKMNKQIILESKKFTELPESLQEQLILDNINNSLIQTSFLKNLIEDFNNKLVEKYGVSSDDDVVLKTESIKLGKDVTELVIPEHKIIDIVLSEDFILYGDNAYFEDLEILNNFKNSSVSVSIIINNKSYKEEHITWKRDSLMVEYINQEDTSNIKRILKAYENTMQEFIDFAKNIAVVYNAKRSEILESLKNKEFLIDKDNNVYVLKYKQSDFVRNKLFV